MRPFVPVLRFALLLAAVAVARPALAQPADAVATAAAPADTTEIVRLDLADGSTLVGTVLREDAGTIEFRTTGGALVTLAAGQVERRRPYEGAVRNGRLVRYDPNRTRLMFSPTARSIPQGSGYLAAYEIFLPFVAYGPGAGVSLSAGTVFAPGAFGNVIYGAPKFTLIERDDLAVAVGAFVLGVNGGDFGGCSGSGCTDDGYYVAGLPFAVGTLGGAERSVTVGFGVPVGEDDDDFAPGAALVLVGGEVQVSNSVKLLTENYLAFDGGETTCEFDVCTDQGGSVVVLGAGVRFFGERLAADLGAFTSPQVWDDGAGFPFAPWIGFSYVFGQ